MSEKIISKQVLVKETGDPQKSLILKKKEMRKIGENEVLVKMIAAPINPADLLMISGNYGIKQSVPFVAGMEGLARVVETGSKIKSVVKGDRLILTSSTVGSWQTYAVLSENQFWKLPSQDLKYATASMLFVNPLSAFAMLTSFKNLQPGDLIVQNGGNSSVGLLIIQMARHRFNCKTISIVRKRANISDMKASMQSLGADYVLTEEELYGGRGKEICKELGKKPKVALDCVGGKNGEAVISLHPEVLVVYGCMSSTPLSVSAMDLIFENVELKGFWINDWLNEHMCMEGFRKAMEEVYTLLEQGKVKVSEPKEFRLEDFKDAIQQAAKGFVNQKMIFVFN